jgi:MFS family permease
MSEVGRSGTYQKAIVLMSCIICFIYGMFFLGSSYSFAVAPYTQCLTPHQGTLCPEYACTLPLSLRNKFRDPQIAQLKTLGNAFGDYSCGSIDVVLYLTGVEWIGALIGAIVVSSLADNLGRRPIFLMCLSLTVAGYSLILLAHTIVVAGIGLFFVGFSLYS